MVNITFLGSGDA
ncbi:Protein of unknown function [Bacillus cytotoxicus]|uniref:Uncharacterized protein n=1 Tax=Bacillus cytotoxicus TaxID=580165 RepID=A0AAX2CGQ3_9BACI|nr:Protein of unknown function [Bacillus cytotoxicus]